MRNESQHTSARVSGLGGGLNWRMTPGKTFACHTCGREQSVVSAVHARDSQGERIRVCRTCAK